MNKNMENISNSFVQDIKTIIGQAQSQAVRSVVFYRVQMYWQMGERIFNEEQQGKDRAEYGAYLIRNLAKELEPVFHSGNWNVAGNFIAFIQLRTHCGRNLIGLNIRCL